MRSRATIKWMGLALAGLLIAVGVAIAAGNLAGQQIGLASEPISAGDALAPATSTSHGHGSSHSGHGHGGKPQTGTTAPTITSPPVETAAPAPPPSVEAQPPAGGEDHPPGSGDSGGEGADD